MNDGTDDRIKRIAAARARKLIFWAIRRGEEIPDAMIERMVQSQTWRLWGYDNLVKCLEKEFGLSRNRAIDFTVEAIIGGYEHGEPYGIDEDRIRATREARQNPPADDPCGEDGGETAARV